MVIVGSLKEEKAQLVRRHETVQGPISNVLAGCFSLTAFAVALIAGLAGDNAASNVLLRALIAMILAYPVGLVAGMICARAIDAGVQNARNRRQESTPAELSDSQVGDADDLVRGPAISV